MARQRILLWALAGYLLAMEPAVAALPQFEQPEWSALSTEQKAILAPLEGDWSAMDPFRRKKWLGIAARYADMSHAEQTSIQRNMREWAQLHPEQRKLARQKFIALQKTTPEQRQAVKLRWEEYQTLTQEERDQLRQKVAARPTPPKTPSKPPAGSVPPGQAISKIRPVVRTPASPLSPLKPPLTAPAPQQSSAKPSSG